MLYLYSTLCSAILRRSLSSTALEEPHEVLGVLETEFLADLCHRQCEVVEQFLGMHHHVVGNEVMGGLARLDLHQFAEISRRQAALVSEIRHRGHAAALCLRVNIVVEQMLKLAYGAVIYLLARDELPLIEAQTVVEQHLYVVDDDATRVLVYGMLYLLLYDSEH